MCSISDKQLEIPSAVTVVCYILRTVSWHTDHHWK